MPSILTVDPGLMRRVDTRNTENLFSMWSVFSRCAASLEDGRRLENLSWRLWNRETFCCDSGDVNATTPAISIAHRSSDGKYTDMPDLSGSVDSLADEEAIEWEADDTCDVRPRIQRQDSSGSSRSRGRERHITPDDLEKMVMTIKEKKDLEPLASSTHIHLAPLAPIATSFAPSSPQIMRTPPTPVAVENASVKQARRQAASSPARSPAPTSHPHQESVQADQDSTSLASDKSSQPSETSVSSERSTTSVVRGFSPSRISSSYRSIPLLAPSSIPRSALAGATRPKKVPVNFALGGSSQSGDDSYIENPSIEHRVKESKKKNNIFTLGGSSNEDENSLRDSIHRSSLTEGLRQPLQRKKQTSFLEEVATRTIHEDSVLDDDVFEDTDEDEIDESAIDDDDSSDWEDSIEESGKSSIEEKLSFPRVDSRPNLVSRRSLITTMLHQGDRAAALANAASRSTPAMQRSRTSSPNGPSLAASPDSDDNAPLMMKKKVAPSKLRDEIPRSIAQPIIMTTTNSTTHQAALSPKTTRRQMLATELTASLRRHLLWERQQKNPTANAALKRRHTAHDVANLKQYPEKVHLGNDDTADSNSWNQYFGTGLGEYHSKGW